MSQPAGGSGRGQGPLDPDEKARFERRLSDLGDRLGKAQKPAADDAEAELRGRAMGMGFGIAIQLVVGVAVGALIGLALDRWLGTQPWLLIVFVMAGFAAGMLNVVRTAREMQKISEAQSKGAKSVPGDEDDK
jgi:ATP synthase protein I